MTTRRPPRWHQVPKLRARGCEGPSSDAPRLAEEGHFKFKFAHAASESESTRRDDLTSSVRGQASESAAYCRMPRIQQHAPSLGPFRNRSRMLPVRA